MDEISLSELLKAGEGETLEYKEQWTDSLLETLSAFANQRGGRVLIGVADSGRIQGWDGKDADLNGLASKISDALKIHPSIERIDFKGRNVVVISITTAGLPVSYRGRYFRRVAGTTREISPDELAQFFVAKMGITWDGVPEDYLLEDIDSDTVNDFIAMAARRLPQLDPGGPVDKLLNKLELLVNGKPTRAAFMLFGKNPQRLFISSGIHMGRFKTPTDILDDNLLRGNIFQLLKQVMLLFQQYQQVRFEIGGDFNAQKPLESLQRKEVWKFPLEALREALLNALLHRDYFIASGEITIKVFDDAVVISNPGALQQDMTVEELQQENHRSILRNPRIARVLYYASMIERWGSGTTRMISSCLDSGLPPPEFRSGSGWFHITFREDIFSPDYLKAFRLKERQVSALIKLKKAGRITNSLYQEATGIKRATAALDLSELVEKGLLEKVGVTGRSAYYVLKGGKTYESSADKPVNILNVQQTSGKRPKRITNSPPGYKGPSRGGT